MWNRFQETLISLLMNWLLSSNWNRGWTYCTSLSSFWLLLMSLKLLLLNSKCRTVQTYPKLRNKEFSQVWVELSLSTSWLSAWKSTLIARAPSSRRTAMPPLTTSSTSSGKAHASQLNCPSPPQLKPKTFALSCFPRSSWTLVSTTITTTGRHWCRRVTTNSIYWSWNLPWKSTWIETTLTDTAQCLRVSSLLVNASVRLWSPKVKSRTSLR